MSAGHLLPRPGHRGRPTAVSPSSQISCRRAAHTTASMGVFTLSRSHIDRSRLRSVRALSSSFRAATSAVTPVAICASNRSSSSLRRGSSVPRRVSVACSTPSSLVPGDDYGDAAGSRMGTGRPHALDRRWPLTPIGLRDTGTPVTIHTLRIREGTSPRVREETSRSYDRDRNPLYSGGVIATLSRPHPFEQRSRQRS